MEEKDPNLDNSEGGPVEGIEFNIQQQSGFPSQDMIDFSTLIGNILDYYSTKEPLGEGEQWKKGSDLETRNIPESLDNKVEEVFKNLLEEFNPKKD